MNPTNQTEEKDPRYPVTHCMDYLRSLVGPDELSRADASILLTAICNILGLDHDAARRAIADHYLSNREEIDKRTVDRLLANILGPGRK